VTDLIGWRNMVTWLERVPVRKVGAQPKSKVAQGSKGQGELITRILRRPLMILVMVVLRMRP